MVASIQVFVCVCVFGSVLVQAHSDGLCVNIDPCTGEGQMAYGTWHSLTELTTIYGGQPCPDDPSKLCSEAIAFVDGSLVVYFTNAVDDVGGIPDAPGWTSDNCMYCIGSFGTLSWHIGAVSLGPGDHSVDIIPESNYDYFAIPQAGCFPMNVQVPSAYEISCAASQVTTQSAFPACSAVAVFGDAVCVLMAVCPGQSCSVDRVSGQASSTSFPFGITPVEWALEVNSVPTGQTCEHTVDVRDETPPQNILCSADVTTTCTGTSGAPVTFVAATADDCQPIAWTQSHMSGDTFPVGTTTVTFTATDSSNNPSSCSFDVIVEAGSPSIQNCPASIVVTDDDITEGQAVVSWTEPTAIDGCMGSLAINRIAGPAPGSTFNVETDNPTTVTYRTDPDPESGQQLDCSFVISFIVGPGYGRIVSVSQLNVEPITELAIYVPFTLNTELVGTVPQSALGRLWLSDGTNTVNIATESQSSMTFDIHSLASTFVGAHGLIPGPVTLWVTVDGQPFEFINQLDLTLVTGNIMP